MTVTHVNQNPVAVTDGATVNENAASAAIDVLANDTDVDPGDTALLIVTLVSNPPHGTASVTVGGGSVMYQPDHNYSGSDTFTYTVSDGHGGTATGTVNVTVTATGLNNPPVIFNAFPTVVQGSGPVRIDVLTLAGDFDPDGDPLTMAGFRQGTSGKVAITSDHKALTYDPNGSFVGTDSFAYAVIGWPRPGSPSPPSRYQW